MVFKCNQQFSLYGAAGIHLNGLIGFMLNISDELGFWNVCAHCSYYHHRVVVVVFVVTKWMRIEWNEAHIIWRCRLKLNGLFANICLWMWHDMMNDDACSNQQIVHFAEIMQIEKDYNIC